MNREKKRKYDKDTYIFLKNHNLCVRCKKNKSYKNYNTCLQCKEDLKIYNNKKKKEYYIKNSEVEKKIKKYKRNINKKNGICTSCGKRKAKENRTKCIICTSKYKKPSKREKYILEEKCVICGNERYKEYKICKKCLDKANKARVKALEVIKKKKENGYMHEWTKDNKIIFTKRKE